MAHLLNANGWNLLHANFYHGVADDVVADPVARLEFVADYFLGTVTVFHLDGFVEPRVKRFANSLDSLYAKLGNRFFKLRDDALDAFDVVVALERFGHVLKRTLKVVDNRQQLADDVR